MNAGTPVMHAVERGITDHLAPMIDDRGRDRATVLVLECEPRIHPGILRAAVVRPGRPFRRGRLDLPRRVSGRPSEGAKEYYGAGCQRPDAWPSGDASHCPFTLPSAPKL